MRNKTEKHAPVAKKAQKHSSTYTGACGICTPRSKYVRLLRNLGDYVMSLSPLKQKMTAAFAGAAAILVPMNAANADMTPVTTAKTEQAVTSSSLKPDENGVLWMEAGIDKSRTLGTAGRLSGEKNAIVIYVATSKAVEKKALDRAKLMKDWLEKHPKVNTQVSIVAKNIEKGAGYVFLLNGVWDKSHELSNNGVFSPSNAPKALNDVVTGYLASLYNEEQRKAGEPVASVNEPN